MNGVLKVCLMVAAVVAMAATGGVAAEFFDGFEDYAAGTSLQDVGGWKGWDNTPAAAAPVSDAFAYAGANSVEIAGAADLVHEFDVTGGQWTASSMQYIPGNATGATYYILLDKYADGGPNAWAEQLLFDLDANTVEGVDLVRDAWTEIRVEADLDNNLADVYYNDMLLHSGAWSTADPPNPSIGAIDLYANNADPVYYDNVSIAQAVPEPTTLALLIIAGLGLLVASRRR